MTVIGRRPGDGSSGAPTPATGAGPTGDLGWYRAPDGSRGGRVGIDFDRPHVVLVVGKRGSGKSYTLGVLAEALARARGLAPVVVDPMGAFRTLSRPADGKTVPATVVEPRVDADALAPDAWCRLLGLDATDAVGALVWQAAENADSLTGMRAFVADSDATAGAKRAATNHLRLADSWNVFAEGGQSVFGGEASVLDLSGRPTAPREAVAAAVASRLYRERTRTEGRRLPWLLVDEAHAFFEGVARRELDRLLTRGRQPGVSVVLATQRPSVLPEVAVSQADIVIAHQLSSRADREALAGARTYLAGELAAGLPTVPGGALVADDATETVHRIRVRERDTPHGGASPRASTVEVES